MTGQIFTDLAAVMADVQGVRKGETNMSGGYRFRGIDAVTNAVGPALRRHKVIVSTRVIEASHGEILVGRGRTPMGHARVQMEYTFWATDGSSVTCSAPGEAFDSGDKATAKACSVAYRTVLIQALCLPTDEPDPDSHSYDRAPTATDIVLGHHGGDADAAMQGAIGHGLTLPGDLDAYATLIQEGKA